MTIQPGEEVIVDKDFVPFWEQRKKEPGQTRNWGLARRSPSQMLRDARMKSLLVGLLLLWSAVGAQVQAGASGPSREISALQGSGSSSVDAGDYVYFSAEGPAARMAR